MSTAAHHQSTQPLNKAQELRPIRNPGAGVSLEVSSCDDHPAVPGLEEMDIETESEGTDDGAVWLGGSPKLLLKRVPKSFKSVKNATGRGLICPSPDSPTDILYCHAASSLSVNPVFVGREGKIKINRAEDEHLWIGHQVHCPPANFRPSPMTIDPAPNLVLRITPNSRSGIDNSKVAGIGVTRDDSRPALKLDILPVHNSASDENRLLPFTPIADKGQLKPQQLGSAGGDDDAKAQELETEWTRWSPLITNPKGFVHALERSHVRAEETSRDDETSERSQSGRNGNNGPSLKLMF